VELLLGVCGAFTKEGAKRRRPRKATKSLMARKLFEVFFDIVVVIALFFAVLGVLSGSLFGA